MVKIFSVILLIGSFCNSFAQSDREYWKKWNDNYPKTDILKVLDEEGQYAKKVENDSSLSPYYSRMDKYRFQAIYTGQTKATDEASVASVKRVFKLHAGDPSILDETISPTQVTFQVGEYNIWMLIQPQILSALKQEIKPGSKVTIYCAFFNEHNSKNELRNTFVVSEFTR